MRRHVFICGVGRSGTTALAQLLNAHPSICVGIERYKYLLHWPSAFHPRLFKRCPFFDFRSEETNILPEPGNQWDRIYSPMMEKWDSALVVGDKIPHFFNVLDEVWPTFPDARVVYIIRSIYQVANSWNARAANPTDANWPEANNFERAVPTWNQANRIITRYLDNPQLLVVPYERLFSGRRRELTRICRFLGLRLDPALSEAFVDAVRHYKTAIAGRPARPVEGQEEFIESHADWSAFHAIEAASRAAQPSALRSSLAGIWSRLA